ncbi:transposase [Kitasatospora sp. NPDC101235]|uniref:helix-turn-helix domain-containing protein n=1 Tax=Kitasatospora sp. NPDC101235 TaxID=3364101 RepID=UPI0037FCABD4
MRYPQGGGLTAERQQFREELRLKAAERFAQGEASSVIAKDLRVSVRSVQRWRQMWDKGGPRALRSQGPASLPRLSEKQFAQLEAELANGPAAHGWEDQRWTLARIKTVIGRRFHLTYTVQGVRKLLAVPGRLYHEDPPVRARSGTPSRKNPTSGPTDSTEAPKAAGRRASTGSCTARGSSSGPWRPATTSAPTSTSALSPSRPSPSGSGADQLH